MLDNTLTLLNITIKSENSGALTQDAMHSHSSKTNPSLYKDEWRCSMSNPAEI